MPSVRIRDSAYLQPLRAESPPFATQGNQQPVHTRSTRTGAHNDATSLVLSPPNLLHMRTMPTLRSYRRSSISPPSRPLRPRSGSTASRVHNHLTQRYSATPDSHLSASSSITALPLLSSTYEGEDFQGPLTISTDSPSNDNQTNADSIRATYGSEIHHDDVIEHLDVIGG
jgi:hypothetical protein